MAYQVELLLSARRDLKRIPRLAQARLVAAMDRLVDEPRPPGATKLAGADNVWRIRVGEYRILFEIHDKRLLVLVIRIGHRRDVYRKRR